MVGDEVRETRGPGNAGPKVRAGTLTFILRMTQSFCGKFWAMAYHDLAVAPMAKINEEVGGKVETTLTQNRERVLEAEVTVFCMYFEDRVYSIY